MMTLTQLILESLAFGASVGVVLYVVDWYKVNKVIGQCRIALSLNSPPRQQVMTLPYKTTTNELESIRDELYIAELTTHGGFGPVFHRITLADNAGPFAVVYAKSKKLTGVICEKPAAYAEVQRINSLFMQYKHLPESLLHIYWDKPRNFPE